jgi:hypothetical protein
MIGLDYEILDALARSVWFTLSPCSAAVKRGAGHKVNLCSSHQQ